MNQIPPSAAKRVEWAKRAADKGAIVPQFFEVFTNKVELICGKCRKEFRRSLILNVNDPTYACPECGVKNFVPVKFDLK
ncbi:MAG: hypothetical protein SGJ02_10055 [bacterium]|nr:hypothetical protein [bacterium]